MKKIGHGSKACLLALVVGMPSTIVAQSAPNESKVDAIFSAWNKLESPGCSCGVIKDNKIVYAKGYGSADLEHSVPLNADSMFYIASTTKQFTAASIGLLVLDGKVALQDDIRKYFPEFTNLKATVTVDQLIHHTSGMRDYLELRQLTGRSEISRINNEFVVKLVARQNALNFEPGSQYLYSNTNYVLLAEIVKRVSGKPMSEFAKERIFVPLGMNATRFGDNLNEIIPNRVISYGLKPGGGYIQFIKTIEAYGDGNLLTSVNDLARWDENFYTGKVGGEPFLKMQKTLGLLNSGKATDYGLGVMYGEYRGQPLESHGGSFQGFRTELLRFPKQHFSVVTLCNLGAINASGLARRVADVYLADQLGPIAMPVSASTFTEVKVDPSIYDRYAGNYSMEDRPQFVLSVTREGDGLFLTPSGQPRTQLFPSSDTTFYLKVANAQIEFRPEPDGHVNRITLHQNGDHDGRRINSFTLQPSALNEYAGKYYSDELDVTYEFVVENGQLSVRNLQGRSQQMSPWERDTFVVGMSRVVFRRNASGKIDGATYSANRIKNLLFVRQSAAMP